MPNLSSGRISGKRRKWISFIPPPKGPGRLVAKCYPDVVFEPVKLSDDLALKRLGDAKPLSASVEAVETAQGQKQLSSYLASRPFPHFEPAAGHPGLLVKVDADGTRTLGRFIQRAFSPVEAM